MDVLATRILSYGDENGDEQQVCLTIFRPFEVNEYKWKCVFGFDPPIKPENVGGLGIDFLGAFVHGLSYARLYFETTSWSRRGHWRGLGDYGLPSIAKTTTSLGPENIPPPSESVEAVDVLATRAVGYRDGSGVETERCLTIFVPLKVGDKVWKCGFTFDPLPRTSIRYGLGEDFIEALLDALASARAMYEGTTPKGCEPLEMNSNCDDLPYKVGRSFWMGRSRESLPDTSDVSAP